jgi:hypothetical protein
MIKILQIRNIAVVSLLGFVMMFAAIAPSMNNAYAGLTIVEFCMLAGPTWTGIGVVEDGIILAKCFDSLDPCFAEGVPVKSDGPTTCTILVLVNNQTGQNVILKDTIPAEWNVSTGLATGVCDDNLTQANKGKKADKSATLFTCDATTSNSNQGAFLDITTRESPGSLKGNQETAKFKPTSCELFANSGAQLILADELGEPVLDDNDQPIVLAETGPLLVPVVGEECELVD